jgi:hypothetical protein
LCYIGNIANGLIAPPANKINKNNTINFFRVLPVPLKFYHQERNHQGLNNTIPLPATGGGNVSGKIKTRERLGGLLKYYYRQAA